MEHIFILNINQLKDGDTFRYYFNEMSRERQNKIMQFKMELTACVPWAPALRFMPS